MRESRSGIALLLIVSVLSLFGCTHNLEIKNFGNYRTSQVNSFKRNCSIGVILNSDDPVQRRIIKGMASSLSLQSEVIYPYAYSSPRNVDYVVMVSMKSQYVGSGWNFLINWPGFVIFAPAWNGYIYEVKYMVDVSIKKGKERQDVGTFAVPINLDLRHSSYNRTWTEVSWCLLDLTTIAFVGGVVFTEYDQSVTPVLIDNIEVPLGEYLAQEVINRIAAQEL